jgi:hypothetical protein
MTGRISSATFSVESLAAEAMGLFRTWSKNRLTFEVNSLSLTAHHFEPFASGARSIASLLQKASSSSLLAQSQQMTTHLEGCERLDYSEDVLNNNKQLSVECGRKPCLQTPLQPNCHRCRAPIPDNETPEEHADWHIALEYNKAEEHAEAVSKRLLEVAQNNHSSNIKKRKPTAASSFSISNTTTATKSHHKSSSSSIKTLWAKNK